MALAATRARLCAAGASAAADRGARAGSVAAARAVRGAVNMPSRSIAAVLLRAEAPVANGALYAAAREYGLLRSHRHFKHTLRMMKEQRRVQVIPGPPVRRRLLLFQAISTAEYDGCSCGRELAVGLTDCAFCLNVFIFLFVLYRSALGVASLRFGPS